MKRLFFYLLIGTYVGSGLLHFIFPEFYLWLMPAWLPAPMLLIYLSGVVEVLIGLALFQHSIRKYAAMACVAMLLVFLFVIHLPQAIDFVQNDHPYKLFTVIRIPLQLVLIWWLWVYRKFDAERD